MEIRDNSKKELKCDDNQVDGLGSGNKESSDVEKTQIRDPSPAVAEFDKVAESAVTNDPLTSSLVEDNTVCADDKPAVTKTRSHSMVWYVKFA